MASMAKCIAANCRRNFSKANRQLGKRVIVDGVSEMLTGDTEVYADVHDVFASRRYDEARGEHVVGYKHGNMIGDGVIDDFDNHGYLNDDMMMRDYDDWYNEIMKQSFLPENKWKGEAPYDPNDHGVGLIRWMMESVKPADVHLKDLKWVAEKYTILSAALAGGLLPDVSCNDDTAQLYSRCTMAIEDVLQKHGVEYEPFGGLTDRGWETFREHQSAVGESMSA